jgi:CheY-like chemotaxis protein
MTQAKQVLVVDDDDVVQQLVKMMVERRGAKAALAGNGDEVNRLFASGAMSNFTLFFVDLILPDITGWDIIARLKDDPATAGVPIVVLTGALLSEAEKERILGRANAVLEKKHFTMAAFEKLLDQWL